MYKQLSELQNLRSMSIHTDTEYATDKETIMGLLKDLKATDHEEAQKADLWAHNVIIS